MLFNRLESMKDAATEITSSTTSHTRMPNGAATNLGLLPERTESKSESKYTKFKLNFYCYKF